MNKDKKEEYKKVGFDARLHYYPQIMNLEKQADRYMILGNNYGRFICLRRILSLIGPFIRAEHRKKLHEMFTTARAKLDTKLSRQLDKSLARRAEEYLTKIDDQIHEYGKDLFLPQGTAESEEVDWDDIIKRGRT